MDQLLQSGILVCLKCGECAADIIGWQGRVALIRCSLCGASGGLYGFSVGCVSLTREQKVMAYRDKARNRINGHDLGRLNDGGR